MGLSSQGNAANIVIGAAIVQVTTTGGVATDVGYTRGGVSVSYQADWKEIIADQVIGVVRKARTMEKMFVKTTVLETTLFQIQKAFMQPVANLVGSTLSIGYNQSCWTDNVILTITGKCPGCGVRTYTFTNCVTMGTKELNQKREEEQVLALEWECLKGSNGLFGTITDSVGTWGGTPTDAAGQY